MPTPKTGYWLSGGTQRQGKDDVQLPSVTTITGRYKESGGLLHWAWKQGTEGKDFRETRAAAADAGTRIHERIRCWASGDPQPPAEEDEDLAKKVRAGFEAFMGWADHVELGIVAHERPLIFADREVGFGGTPDALGITKSDGLVLVDWKTGGIYADVVLQLAAYRFLAAQDGESVSVAHVVRFDRTWGTFMHRNFTSEQLDIGWAQFRDLRRCYGREALLKSMVR